MSFRHLATVSVGAFSLTSLFVLALASPLGAGEILLLTNGRQIAVDRYWEKGDQVFYQKNGSTFGFPRYLLERVEGEREREPDDGSGTAISGYRNTIANEELEAARSAARAGEPGKAIRFYRAAIAKAPDEIHPRIELAELQLEEGELFGAQSQLEQAKRLDAKNLRVRELLGDVYYARGRTALAIREWQLALAEDRDPGLLYKLKKALRENDDDIFFDEVERPNFVIRYEGSVNAAIGRAVGAALDEEFYQLVRELRFTPRSPVVVTLYTNQEFRDVTNSPSWASALNDGEIRVPVEGLREMTEKLRRVLRHELTHSFVNALTAGNCPAWFHEGLAQLREGGDKTAPYPRLRAAQADGTLLPLWTLEGPLTGYSKDKARLAYAQALSATEYLAARRGRDALARILRLLAERKSMNEALKQVIGLDYQEFQTAWEADLGRYESSGH